MALLLLLHYLPISCTTWDVLFHVNSVITMTSITFITSYGIREINKRDYDIIKSNPNHPNYNNVSIVIQLNEQGQQLVQYVLEFQHTIAVIH